MRLPLPGGLAFLFTLTSCLGSAFAQASRTTEPAIARPVLRVPDARLPVQLETVAINTDVVGQFAQTRIELVFRNPNAQVLEGELQFPLAPTQTVTGFALDIAGEMRPAVPVDKAKGQQVFEEVIRARVDPALLEATQGDNYKLRVYPLPPHGTRRVALYVAQALTRRDSARAERSQFTLPLFFADRVGVLSASIRIADASASDLIIGGSLADDSITRAQEGTAARLALRRTNLSAAGTLSIALPARSHPLVASQTVAGQTYFYAEVTTQAWTEARPAPRRLALLWDASGSGARRDHEREFALLDGYFKAVRNVDVFLIVGRDVAETKRPFFVRRGRWDDLRRTLAGVAYDGATNLSALSAPANCDLALLFSDGLGNWGSAAATNSDVALYTLSAAPDIDSQRLRALAQASGGEWIDLTHEGTAAAVKSLQVRKARLLRMHGKGLHELVSASPYPDGDRLTLAGKTTVEKADLELEFGFNDTRVRRQHVTIVPRAVPLPASDDGAPLLGQRWAALRVAELEADFEQNRAEIRRIGKSFGLLTRETSLLVLDNVADYVRNEIEPPLVLRAEYERLLAQQNTLRQKARLDHLDRIAARFATKVAWWEKVFPKDDPPAAVGVREGASNGALATSRVLPASPAPEARRESSLSADSVARSEVARQKVAAPSVAATATTIQLTKWEPDSPYARRLRAAAPQAVYEMYLEERPAFSNSTAFFLDSADILFEKGQPDFALRVLSNLAEMDLENRHILRVLAYRLLQATQARLAIPVLQAVQRLSPDEPQSYRDLAFAYAEDEQWQSALDQLWQVVARTWNNRFPDIELVALAELNAIVERAQQRGTPVQTDRFDARLLRNLPLDLRVVLAWDADNTDIDLWVIDPNGETAFYGKPLSYQGGRMSADFTGGYGPEEFSLRHAKPGKYTVQAQFYGHRQQIVAPATTLMLRLTTGFGTNEQKDEMVTVRLAGKNELITVGSFAVRKH